MGEVVAIIEEADHWSQREVALLRSIVEAVGGVSRTSAAAFRFSEAGRPEFCVFRDGVPPLVIQRAARWYEVVDGSGHCCRRLFDQEALVDAVVAFFRADAADRRGAGSLDRANA